MKKLLAALGMALGLSLATPASAAIVLTFTPSSQHVNVGDTVGIDVSISGGAQILSSFDLNFQYNPALLSWTAINATSVIGELGSNYLAASIFNFDDPLVNGDLGMIGYALADDATVAAGQSNAFLIAHFELQATADGVTSFGLGSDPDFERNFVGLDFQSLDIDVGSACVAIGTGDCTTVPEPASYALFGLALGTMLLVTSRRRRSSLRTQRS